MKLINDNYGRVKKKSGNFQTVAPSKMQKTWSKLASKSLKCISNTPFETKKVLNGSDLSPLWKFQAYTKSLRIPPDYVNRIFEYWSFLTNK